MECWNIGFNRGFKRLRVWQDAVSLYILACNIVSSFPFELKKVAATTIDAAQYKRWIRPTRHGVLEYWSGGRMALTGIFSIFYLSIFHFSIIPTQLFLSHLWPPAHRGLCPRGKTCHCCLGQSAPQWSFSCALSSRDYGYPVAVAYPHHNES
jgi:hypothetical protein